VRLPLETLIEIDSAEAAWTRAAQAGDRAAFGRLYERYARMVHGILLAYVPYGEAEDLVQDVFVAAMGRLDGLREAGAVGGWLAAIARNAALESLRRGKRHPMLSLVDRFVQREAGKVEAMGVLREIQKLPEAYRETLVLRLVEGMTGPEIAARTGLTAESVRVNLCRGMKMLRERLEVA
jgi:RNA polymerase sigma-70 factor, ECF subfamily